MEKRKGKTIYNQKERFLVSNYRRTIRWCLRNEFSVAGAIETPAMVDTLQSAPLINPPFRKRSQSMRTHIIKHLPGILVPVPPHHRIKTDHLLGMRNPLVKITHRHYRIPLQQPIELLFLAMTLNLWLNWVDWFSGDGGRNSRENP